MELGGDNVFRGEYSHSLDSKGRLILPLKFRELLGERFIITRSIGIGIGIGIENCLFVYGIREWEAFEQKAVNMPLTDAKTRRFIRFFFGGAHEADTDSQGRAVIPQHLREYAGLVKDAISIGLPNRIEIWSKENWKEYNSKENFIDGDLAMYITEIGF